MKTYIKNNPTIIIELDVKDALDILTWISRSPITSVPVINVLTSQIRNVTDPLVASQHN